MKPIFLETDNLFIRSMQLNDWKKIEKFDSINEQHFTKWASTRPLPIDHKKYIRRCLKEFKEGQSIRFVVFLKNNNETVISVINFSQIFRGAFQACYLGYRIDKNFEGRGLMYEALQKTISYMFNNQNLHRIMANYMPTNKRSEKLLFRLGFKVEGKALKYLRVNGEWEDHILTSLINASWSMPSWSMPLGS